MKRIITLVFLIISATSFAQEAVENLLPMKINEEFSIKSGDTKIISLPRFAFIDRVTMEVKTVGVFCSENSFRVSFDGQAAQDVDVKGGLAGYRSRIITAIASARNIEIYNRGDCKIKIKNIEVLPRRINVGRGHGGHGPAHYPMSDAGAQVSFLLEGLLYLDTLVGDSDRIQYLSQGKKVVGNALAVLKNAPETSQASHAAINQVIQYLNASQVFFERLSTIESTFEISQDIQSVKVTLERMIR